MEKLLDKKFQISQLKKTYNHNLDLIPLDIEMKKLLDEYWVD